MPKFCRRLLSLFFTLNLISPLLLGDISLAQIVRDGTVGPAVGSVVEPVGPNYQIDSTLGRIEGANLFHSFSDFNVQTLAGGTVERATFTNSQSMSINNILSRVTGGNASTINGTLASTIENANLFLLNPNGVVFGSNASLDLKGSFHVSTADVLRFDNGQAFYMDASLDGAMDSVLRMPSLSNFGFLDEPTSLAFSQSGPASPIIIEPGLNEAKTLTVPESKTLSITGGNITVTNKTLRAGGGQVHLISINSTGAIDISDQTAPTLDSFIEMGQISLTQTTEPTPLNSVLDTAQGDSRFTKGGSIFIRGGSFTLDAGIVSSNLDILVNTLRGRGTELKLESPLPIIEARIVSLVAKESIIFDALFIDGKEAPGVSQSSITLKAPLITISNSVIGIETQATQGNRFSDDLRFEADTLQFSAVKISSVTNIGADAGNVTIAATKGATITGGQILTGTSGGGAAGDIRISAPLLILNGTAFSAETRLLESNSPGGDVRLNVGRVEAENTRLTTSSGGGGLPGNISISANSSIDLSATDIATTVSGGSQPSGSITLRAHDSVVLRNKTTVSASNDGLDFAGNIEIGGTESSPSVLKTIIEDDSNQFPAGSASLQEIHLVNTIRLKNSAIETSSPNSQGGNITLSASFLIDILDSQLTSEITQVEQVEEEGIIILPVGRGGNIDFDPQFIVLRGNSLISTSAVGFGNGGTITLGRPGNILFVAPTVTLDVSSQSGQSGTISVGATTQSLSEEVPRPDIAIIDPQNFLPVRCASQQGGSFSSIVEDGLDALPPEPGDFFPSPIPVFGETARSASSVRQSSISLEALPFGLSATQEGSDLPSQIALGSSHLGCSL